ncbi:MAG: beta-galactosidase, partial [Candidatus Omnitrophica bacterium]|nr:beta-galactosidase [Candidatus Omnitrophota bacterium]
WAAENRCCRVEAVLAVGGVPMDRIESGFVREDTAVLHLGPELRFVNNYFTLNRRPVFLFGSDDYSTVYSSASENPLTWSQELSAARDAGMNLYENLQYIKPGHKLEDSDWRVFLALNQLTQKYRLIFMPGMLIGHDVAVGDEALAEQSALCLDYARHLADTPGLLYYINGDYQNNPSQLTKDVRILWNRWLKLQYDTTDQLRSAWGIPINTELGNIDFPPPNSGRWDDPAAVDKMRFQNWLVARWNEAHVKAVRRQDALHPITSEYYSSPFAGIDLRLSIDGQDVSNIGFFDRPGLDLDNLPLRLRWNDLRLRGKGISLGEYGVKTHPAWTVSNGARDYHIRRTEEEQEQLFLTVAHYALGMGASKVQNWCLRDGQASVFPWGIFYPNQLVWKDIAYVHRNESFVWRHFTPVYSPPSLAVCLSTQLRLGNSDGLGAEIADRTFADLLALHYDFGVIDDDRIDEIPPTVKVMIYPSPFTLTGDTYRKVLAWVRHGGTILITGDFSYDAIRQRTATARLEELAGVRLMTTFYPNVSRQNGHDAQAEFSWNGMTTHNVRLCIGVKPVLADTLGQTSDGQPALVRASVGSGRVYFFPDPIDLAGDESAKTTRRELYGAFLEDASLKPLDLQPPAPWLHLMTQPTAQGLVYSVVNTRTNRGDHVVQLNTLAGPVRLSTRNRWPALAAVSRDSNLVAINADAQAWAGGQSVMDGTGMKMLLSLDGEDLRRSAAILAAPLEPGRLVLPPRPGDFVFVIGEFQNGQWIVLERVTPSQGNLSLKIDPDRATGLILMCPRTMETTWSNQLTKAMFYPDQITGY